MSSNALWGSISCLFVLTKGSRKIFILGERHNISDGNSRLLNLLVDRRAFFEMYAEQISPPICFGGSTLDRLLCQTECNLNCAVDLRGPVARRFATHLRSWRRGGRRLHPCDLVIWAYENDARRFCEVFANTLMETYTARRQWNRNLLMRLCRRAWGHVIPLVKKSTRRDRVVEKQLMFMPVPDVLFAYAVYDASDTGMPIVYIAGQTHAQWAVELLRSFSVRKIAQTSEIFACLERELR